MDSFSGAGQENPAEFFPYWEGLAAGFVEAAKEGFHRVHPAGIYASAYRGRGRAVLWLVNEDEKGQSPDLWIDEQALLGRSAKTLRDMETGEDAVRIPERDRVKGDALAPHTWAHVYVPPQTFRALVLE